MPFRPKISSPAMTIRQSAPLIYGKGVPWKWVYSTSQFLTILLQNIPLTSHLWEFLLILEKNSSHLWRFASFDNIHLIDFNNYFDFFNLNLGLKYKRKSSVPPSPSSSSRITIHKNLTKIPILFQIFKVWYTVIRYQTVLMFSATNFNTTLKLFLSSVNGYSSCQSSWQEYWSKSNSGK